MKTTRFLICELLFHPWWQTVCGLVLAGGLLLSSCIKEGDTVYMPDPTEETASTAPLVTVIYGPGDLGDRRYCDLIYTAVERAAATYGLRTMQLSPQSFDEGIRYLEMMFSQMSAATDTVRRLFIVPQPAYDEYLRANSNRLEDNPYADLLYLETPTPLAGKGSTLYMPYYGAMFEAGALTALDDARVMLAGANPHNASVVEAMQGFADGFAADDAASSGQRVERELRTVYLSGRADGGFSIADTTAMRLIDEWTHEDFGYLVPVCGGSFNTFSRLNMTMNWPFLMIGIDADDHAYFIPFTAVKHIDHAVMRCIGQWLSPDGMPKHQVLGLADGYTEVAKHWEWALVDVPDASRLDAIHEEAVRRENEKVKSEE